jgi:geranylgeranyl diphosphate synthase type II
MNGFESEIKKVEKSLKDNKWGTSPSSLYEPIHYIMTLGGKRLRPLLTLMGYSKKADIDWHLIDLTFEA